jgi:uncharacterized damage-inducible protein DinB
MDASDFRRLFRYDRWANHEVAEVLNRTPSPPAKSVNWMAHIVAAEALWLARLQQRPAPMPVWPKIETADLLRQVHDVHGAWHDYLEALDDAALGTICDYVNSKGERYSSSVEDILTHVLMHSTYHRGQIAADLRASGVEPVYTDFIHAVRQGHLG